MEPRIANCISLAGTVDCLFELEPVRWPDGELELMGTRNVSRAGTGAPGIGGERELEGNAKCISF